MLNITAITWDIYSEMLITAAGSIPDVKLNFFSSKSVDADRTKLEAALKSAEQSDIIFLYRSTESFWDEIENELNVLREKIPVVCISSNPSFWSLSSVSLEHTSLCYDYLIYGGRNNFFNLMNMLKHLAEEKNPIPEKPVKIPWEGIYHPASEEIFSEYSDYGNWYGKKFSQTVGIIFGRSYWVNENREMIDLLIEKFEKAGVGCIPIFTYSVKDKDMGTMSVNEIIEKFYIKPDASSRINALIKLVSISGENNKNESVEHGKKDLSIFEKLNVPVFQPVISSYKSSEEWQSDPHGLGAMTSWYVTMPEFEGVIEPVILAAADRNDSSGLKKIMPIHERTEKIVGRIKKWIELAQKPLNKRKVAFVLHNNPCSSVEASVGGAAHLDSFESVAAILKNMGDNCYEVNPPVNGAELAEIIMSRKAISEFRWTTVDEIITKGGCLKEMEVEQYRTWFDGLSEKFKSRITDVWGNPPGEAKNGVPAAMVHDGKIVITGVGFGSAIVCVQPKRGCAGTSCDGRVCKLLHDPDIPPPHQYFATYRYIENDFKADVVIHVGTHGNLEFLPGKGNALSGDCSPDLAIGSMPHLYIYNADNPPEGAIAKRRSYAVLVDHLQAVMVKSGLTPDLEELDRLLDEYNNAKGISKSRTHTLEHMIIETIKKTNLSKEIRLTEEMQFESVVKAAHESLSLLKGSQMNSGMHIFGNIPHDENRIDYIRSIMRAVSMDGVTLRGILCGLNKIDLEFALKNQGKIFEPLNKSYGTVLDEIEETGREFIRRVVSGNEDLKEIVSSMFETADEIIYQQLKKISSIIKEIEVRIESSDEFGGLLKGFNGNFIPVGPSGKITRGRYEIMPTGRNFYTLDIHTLPTKAAYRIGTKLAHGVIEKHLNDEGKIPNNVAIYWTCMDITCADGEGMGQIMNLVGARPLWSISGRVEGFEIIPLKELGRPRIDVTVRIGGILRDVFPECVEYIDEVIRAAAALDEAADYNYVRRNTMQNFSDKNGGDKTANWDEASTRIFGSKPGTYMAGVNLAVYASAWKEEKDLADIYIYWNQYAYGKKYFGKEAPDDLIGNLKNIDVTFNKTYTDEYDLFGCCAYFSAHGGLTNAAKMVSGRDVKTYYGDTRDSENIGVRDLSDEVRRVVRTKLLNPKWIDGMKNHGYKGLGDISKIIGRVYGWEATTQAVDDWIFDDITKTYVLDSEMREEFEKNNPWALEEIGRRLLEANERGLWNADPEVLDELKSKYLEVEGWIEERMGDVKGDFQGGNIDILTSDDVADWSKMMTKIHGLTRA